MATIGTFKKSGNDYTGEIVTLNVQAKNVRIVPETSQTSENAPSHRVLVGRAEIGAAWSNDRQFGFHALAIQPDQDIAGLDDVAILDPDLTNHACGL